MKPTDSCTPRWALYAAGMSLLILLAANAFVVTKIMSALAERSDLCPKGRPLPCPAIPTRFILENPACAQKLLEAMNVTDIRVSALPAGLPEEANSTDAREPRGGDSALTW